MSGSDMDPLVYDYTTITDPITMDVTAGKARIFYLEAKDSAGTVIYNGASTAVDLEPDTEVDISISMGKVIISISVTPSGGVLAVGSNQQYSAIASYADSGTADITGSVTWSSTDPAIATITSTGLATGVADGTASIAAAYNSLSTSANLTVNPWGKIISSIAVTPSSDKTLITLTKQFTATATFADSTTGNVTNNVTWASSDSATATINTAGLATGNMKGSVSISATYKSVTSNNAALVVNSWGKIYVANYGSDTVSVIDGFTNAVTTITIGDGPGGTLDQPGGVGVNNITGKVYVSNNGTGTVSVINSSTDAVISTINILMPNSYTDPLLSVGVNPNTNKIFVSGGFNSGDLTLIDGVTEGFSTITTGESYGYGIGVNTSTNKIYMAAWNPPIIIDGTANTVIGSVTGGSWTDSRAVAVNPVTNRIYVASYGSSEVFVIDGSTDSYITLIAVGNAPNGIAVNPITNKIYTADYSGGSVSVIDGSTNTVINTLAGVGVNPLGVTVNPNTNRIYVTMSGGGSVVVIDGSTDTVLTTVTVGTTPSYLDVQL